MPRMLSVSEVNRFLKTLVESNSLLKNLIVEGELSNVKQASSGHLYFSLKDNGGKIDCVMFKNKTHSLNFSLKEGMKISLQGSLSIYAPSGQYQLMVRSIKAQGVGNLYQAYLLLKDRLEKQGYFDLEHKKELPKTIDRVGLLTSATGAAINDMISIIKERNPLMDIVLYPSLVQGEGAVETMISGIKTFNRLKNVDLIIIGRGGGSIEDLWAFNDENLAKVIFDSELPTISAVGHETDFTISDFVADIRAQTPSGAAVLVAEDQENFRRCLKHSKRRLTQCIEKQIQKNRQQVFYLSERVFRSQPQKQLKEMHLNFYHSREILSKKMLFILKEHRRTLKNLEERLMLANPQGLLNRGYILVKNINNQRIDSIKGIKQFETLHLYFKDGEISVEIQSIKENKKWQ